MFDQFMWSVNVCVSLLLLGVGFYLASLVHDLGHILAAKVLLLKIRDREAYDRLTFSDKFFYVADSHVGLVTRSFVENIYSRPFARIQLYAAGPVFSLIALVIIAYGVGAPLSLDGIWQLVTVFWRVGDDILSGEFFRFLAVMPSQSPADYLPTRPRELLWVVWFGFVLGNALRFVVSMLPLPPFDFGKIVFLLVRRFLPEKHEHALYVYYAVLVASVGIYHFV